MSALFYDTHAHLNFPDYHVDLGPVLDRALQSGITRILCIGTDFEGSQKAIELAERYAAVYAVVGWHPSHCMEAPDDLRPRLREWAGHPRVVAIGETGLDYYRLPSKSGEGGETDDRRYQAKQAQVFQQQLEVAAEAGLNVVVHQRAAWEPTLRQMQAFEGRVRGVFHCFSESPDAMREVLGIGGLVSFTGILTFKNAGSVRETLQQTPMDRFMLETDCPFLSPVPYRGKRCEPAYVREIAATAAGVKGVSLEALSEATCSTAQSFFRM